MFLDLELLCVVLLANRFFGEKHVLFQGGKLLNILHVDRINDAIL